MNRIHHLNCGTMHPPATPAGLVCHVLLIETPDSLVLVDSGFGLKDAEARGRRFGAARFYVRPAFDPDEAAIRQLPALGFDPRDVRHIVLTHFDADHVGGLADFPWADVHLTSTEAYATRQPRSTLERSRYRPAQRDHNPRLIEHNPERGDVWRGFAAAEELTDIAVGIVMISLPGHTRGHAAIAAATQDRWILHAGDAVYHHGQLDGIHHAPRAITGMERLVAHDWKKVRANHERLRELWTRSTPDLNLVNAHDPTLLHRARAASPGY